MKCPKCGAENPPGSQFCGECGATLTTTDPAPNQPQTSFQNRPPNTNFGPTYPQQPNPNLTTNPYVPPVTTTTGNRSGSKIIAIILGVIGIVFVIVGIIVAIGASSTAGSGDASYNAGYGLGSSLLCCVPGIVLLIIAAVVFFMANRKQ